MQLSFDNRRWRVHGIDDAPVPFSSDLGFEMLGDLNPPVRICRSRLARVTREPPGAVAAFPGICPRVRF
jgi:hypothetical protein